MKKTLSILLAIVIIAISVISAFAANPVAADEGWKAEYADRNETTGKVIVMPGATRSDITFRWFSGAYGSVFAYSDSKGNKASETVFTVPTLAGLINTVSLTALVPDEYTYTVTSDGQTYTGEFIVTEDDAAFTMAFTTDAQIGRSGNADDDSYGWYRTVNAAVDKGAELILSAGDEANKASKQNQYNQFLSNNTLRNVRLACTKGNHDIAGTNYTTYFGATGTPCTGSDYYFSYGDALIIVLDSNTISSLIHSATIARAIAEHPDAAWRIVMLHHSAYSPDENEEQNVTNAVYLTSIFDRYDIDLVLSGHDHNYSRTYALTDNSRDENGAVYFQANTASACNVCNYDASAYENIEFSYTLHEASYSLLTVTSDTIEVNSYITDTDECFDSFTLTKSEDATENNSSVFVRLFSLIAKIFSFIFNIKGC